MGRLTNGINLAVRQERSELRTSQRYEPWTAGELSAYPRRAHVRGQMRRLTTRRYNQVHARFERGSRERNRKV